MTYEDTRKATSLPASADGASPSDSPDGMMTDLFGQALAPVSPSVPPERARRPMTNATCGLRGFLSSPSATLQSSLESKLKRRLDGDGSTLFSLIWRQKATPAGRPYFQLVASGLRISDNDAGSWPTPCAQPSNGEPEAFLERKRRSIARGSRMGVSLTDLGMVAKLASWPTPRAEDSESSGMRHGRGVADTLTAVASQASPRATPQARDWKGPQGRSYKGEAADLPAQAGWATPNTVDAKGGTRNGQGQVQLCHQASWATPTANEKRRAEEFQEGRALNAAEALGPKPNGSNVGTASNGQLNPEHSRWLMGYSADHLSCAPMATPSSRKSRQK